MKRVLIPGVILCGADVAQAVDDKNMYMHFFEEMTVYAPVPVPVNGNTHYTSESIERLPTGNGNISDLLRTNPAVRMDSTQSTSLNQGDIRPEKISIHGASPYQNAYLIDGISATNNLNPANESDASSATNISGRRSKNQYGEYSGSRCQSCAIAGRAARANYHPGFAKRYRRRSCSSETGDW